jgi:hypothetical protein
MSGIVSGITKVFTSVASGVASVGKSILGVGATLFTGGAASGGALGNVVNSVSGGGVLGNILTGAIKQAGIGALIGGAVGAMTGAGFGKGAMYGALGGAVTGGLSGAAGSGLFSAAGVTPADTATGMAATGSTAGSAAPSSIAQAPGVTTGGGGFGQFLNSEAGGAMLGGLGEGIMGYTKMKAEEKERQRDRDYLLDKEMRVRDSYDVSPEALPGGGTMAALPETQRPSPAQKYQRTRYDYDEASGRVIRVPA